MRFEIISAFIDKRTGRQVEPGEAVPEGLEEDTLERLVQAKCLRPMSSASSTDASAASGEKTDTFRDLFGADEGGAGGGDAGEGEIAGQTEGASAGGADGADSATDVKTAGGRKAKAKK
jgi:hypothetical protein